MSETDARKKSAGFTVKRRTIIAAITALAAIVLACVAVVIISVYNVSLYFSRSQDLRNEIDGQAKTITSYESELDFLKDSLGD